MAGLMAILGSSVDGLVMSPGRVLSTAQPALSLSMVAPKGPWGGSTDSNEGWVGDRGRSAQVKKFEGGSDYLFFQGPSPLYAVQPDLPGVLSGVRTGHGTRGSAASACLDRSRTTHAQENPNPHSNPGPNPCAGEPRRWPREPARRAVGSRRCCGRRCACRSRPGAARLRSSAHSVCGPASITPRMRMEGAER
jgi:hypothetical protein